MNGRHVIVACLVAGLLTAGYAVYARTGFAKKPGHARARCEAGEIVANGPDGARCVRVAPEKRT